MPDENSNHNYDDRRYLSVLCICAALQREPSGSSLAGDYAGAFGGKLTNGKIMFRVYDASGVPGLC